MDTIWIDLIKYRSLNSVDLSLPFKGDGHPYSVLGFFWTKKKHPVLIVPTIGLYRAIARWKGMDLSISEHPKNLKSVKGSRS